MADRCRNMQDISACHKFHFNECICWLIYSLFITVFTKACRPQPHVIFNAHFSIINRCTTNNSTQFVTPCSPTKILYVFFFCPTRAT